MKPYLPILLATLAGITVAPAAATASDQYRTIDLGTLGGNFSHATAVNNRGEVVGQSRTAESWNHAFLWSDGVMTDLGALETPGHSIATDINDAGQIVGNASVEQGWATHAVLWDRGVMTDLGTLGGRHSSAHAINDRGQILGASELSQFVWHAFLWEDGVMSDLGALDIADINDRGQIVGSTLFGEAYHGYLLERGNLTDIGPLTPVASNNRGWIIGDGPSPTGYAQAHVWRSGVMTRLGTPGGYSQARAINDRGDIVGSASAVLYDEIHPFLWRDGVMVDLTTRGLAHDATLSTINNRGQIAGSIIIDNRTAFRAAMFVCRC